MFGLALALLFQATNGDLAQPSQPAPPAAETPAQEKPAAAGTSLPKVICKKQAMTGTRARKITVCHTQEYENQAERQRDNFSRMLSGSGNITPPLPKGIGG